jgi:carbon storage regulator CsrA
MLVLGREEQQTILIGDDIVITVVRVKGREARIGIEAPRRMRVLRGELDRDDSRSSRPANDRTESD